MSDEYLKWLAGPWKQEQQAMKKAGLILNYEVLMVEPRGEDDAGKMCRVLGSTTMQSINLK